MREIQWSSENEVFIAQIDAEHRDLFQLAEGFERAVTQQAPPLAIREHLSAFAAHMAEHFSREEWLMQSVEYPSCGWHKQQHETVRRRLKLLGPLIESGDSEATSLFLEFLANWLNDHTSVTGRMMAAYVRNYDGPTPPTPLNDGVLRLALPRPHPTFMRRLPKPSRPDRFRRRSAFAGSAAARPLMKSKRGAWCARSV
jgi:hemerythrin